MKKIAIIGSGISGLGAAYALKDSADITVFEAEDRPGGHAHTVSVDYDGTPLCVDVGFIVYNGHNYPNLTGLFKDLGVETEPSDMSFAVSNPDGFEWASRVRGLFAERKNLLRPRFHRFWRAILRFNDEARAELIAGKISPDISLGDWIGPRGYSDDFMQNYLLPMGGAIWSTPENELLKYPALSFFDFFENHRLMHKERPKWRTVTNGSVSYVDKIAGLLGLRLKLGSAVTHIDRTGDHVAVETVTRREVFDDVIVAVHTDTATRLLGEAYKVQRAATGAFAYRSNTIYLHRDPALMPKRKAAWASWNVLKAHGEGTDICLTYWMNKLQNISAKYPLFVTLNPAVPPDEALTFARFEKSHPQFDSAAREAAASLKMLQGRDGLWFAGAWMGSGFHEDGLKSGLSCALSVGGAVPWTPEGVELYDTGSNTPVRAA